MKKHIQVTDYAGTILEALPKGILLNTQAETFDSMVIGWGALGTNWGMPVFTAYVRESRFTRTQLDANPAFTVSVPLGEPDPTIFNVCGKLSAREVDKVQKASLTLEEAEVNGVPGIREYPLTLECALLYRQPQDEALYPKEAQRFYPKANGAADCHITYIGKIVSAYLIQ